MTTATILAVSILSLLGIFQITLASGVPLGQFAWGGKHKVLPRNLRLASLSSIVIYLIIIACLVSKSSIHQFIPQGQLLNVLVWIIFTYFTLGIFMNAISRSKPERYIMTPIAATLTICVLTIATG